MTKLNLFGSMFLLIAFVQEASAFGFWAPRRPSQPTYEDTPRAVTLSAPYVRCYDVNGEEIDSVTTSHSLAPDNSQVSVLFTNFSVEAVSSTVESKSCYTFIPVSVPDKRQLTISLVDYRGSAVLDAGSAAQVASSVTIYDRNNRVTAASSVAYRNFSDTEDFVFNDTRTLTNAACGGRFTIRLRSKLSAWSNSGGIALLTLDSADAHPQARVQINTATRTCR